MELKNKIKSILFILGIIFSENVFSVDISNANNVTSNKKMSAEIQKNYIILYFWATWCPDCKDKLKTDLLKYETSQVQFFTVAVEKDISKVKKFITDQNLKYPVFLDETKNLQKSLGVFSVPTVVLLKKKDSQFEKISVVTGKNWDEIDQQLELLKLR